MPNANGFFTPDEIGLRYDYASMRGEDVLNPEMWVGHWPGGSRTFTGRLDESCAALKGYEDYHLSKGWRGVAYDYAADMAGRRYLLRGTGQSAATSGDFDEDGVPNNRESDAVLFLIGPGQVPSTPMKEAFAWFLNWNARKTVIGHMEAKGTQTSCPGPQVMEHLIIPARTGSIGGRKVSSKRIGGKTRHDTAAMLAYTGYPVSQHKNGLVFLLATGSPDGDAASNVAGMGPILTVEKDSLPAATKEALGKYKPNEVVALGLEGAINDSVLAAAVKAAR